ncbi:MAG: hypothetical protein KBA31_02385 [Alphaproteobacteria bacterium]|nr:hypothetical protein [Alphaproteobacteria bacterium]
MLRALLKVRLRAVLIAVLIFLVAAILVARVRMSWMCPNMAAVPFSDGATYTEMTPLGVPAGSKKRMVFEVLLSRWRNHYDLNTLPEFESQGPVRPIAEGDWSFLKGKERWVLSRCGTTWDFVDVLFEGDVLVAVKDTRRYAVP